MEREDLYEKIKEAIEKYCEGLDIDHISELAIDAIWDDIEEYMLDHQTNEHLFDE